jgi:uncharacterized RDD family membrane protein YckC
MSAAITSDDTLVIETPERVPLHFALASIGNRFIACAIDHTIQIVVLIAMVITFLIISDAADFGSRLASAPKWVIALLVIVQFLIINGYFAIFEWLWSGQTPGKRWLKLRVIREDGRPISFFEAMIRNLIRVNRFHRAAILFSSVWFQSLPPSAISASAIWSPAQSSCANANQKHRPSKRSSLLQFQTRRCADPSPR